MIALGLLAQHASKSNANILANENKTKLPKEVAHAAELRECKNAKNYVATN